MQSNATLKMKKNARAFTRRFASKSPMVFKDPNSPLKLKFLIISEREQKRLRNSAYTYFSID